MVFIRALFISTLGCSRILPLVKAMPAKIKATTFLLCAYATYDTFLFRIHPLTEALTSRTLLDSHCFFQIVLRDFYFKFLLFILSEYSESTNFDVTPLLVATYSVILWINVWTEEDEFTSREQATTVHC